MVKKSFYKNYRPNFFGGKRAYRRPPVFDGGKIKAKKELKFPPYLWKVILYSALALALLYLLFFSKFFQIRDVIVEGNQSLSSEKISAYIPKGDNILRFNLTQTRARILSENKEIKNLEIYRGLPNAIKVVVLEYDNKMIWQSNGTQYLVSSQGIVTKKVEAGEIYTLPVVVDLKNLPVSLGESLVSPNFIAFVNNINDNFLTVTGVKPTTFEVPDTTFDINVRTEAGYYVKFNTMRASAKQLDNLKRVLVARKDSVHEYIDLRIDGMGYYK